MNSTGRDANPLDRHRADLICIDRAAQSDLMFWNLMGNGLLGQTDRPPSILIVEPGGSGEFEGGQETAVPEKRVREEVKESVFRLTDLGLATVGFTGCDRNFIQMNHAGIQTGNWSILFDSASRNVVVLVASVACHPERGWMAVSPFEVAQNVAGSIRGTGGSGIRIVHMAQRLTPGLSEAAAQGVPVSVEVLEKDGCLPSGWVPETGHDLHVHHVSRWGAFPPVPVAVVDVSSKNRLD